jgi:flagellar basal-body rod modification protein FlgD
MIQPVTSGPNASAPAKPGGPTLGKEDFLKLLITQLRYQDPLDPLDQNEFLSQTAQFTSLENLQNISAELEAMRTLAQGQALTQGAALLGKSALSAGRDVQLDSGPVALPFSMFSPGSVQIEVLDGQKAIVRHLAMDALDSGPHSVVWNGRDDAGQPMKAGTYHYRVIPQGGAVAVAAQGTLSGMTPTANGVVYHLGDAIVRADDLITVG